MRMSSQGFHPGNVLRQAGNIARKAAGGILNLNQPGIGRLAFNISLIETTGSLDHELGIPDKISPVRLIIVINIPDLDLNDLVWRIHVHTEQGPCLNFTPSPFEALLYLSVAQIVQAG